MGTPHNEPLHGKAALLIGASRGVGWDLARGLGLAGAKVMLVARDPSALEEAVAALQDEGINARWCSADCSTEQGVHHAANEAMQRMGDVDILVQCTASHALAAYALLTQTIAHHSMEPRRSGNIVHVMPVQSFELQDTITSLAQTQVAQWCDRGIAVHCLPANTVLVAQCLKALVG
jgi:NAD(P)-dependent dehydrogenase (short-subunit alcohol dehydrogenase family)